MALLLNDEEAKALRQFPIGPGILMPILAHRFRVRFPGLTKEQDAALCMHTVNFKLDLKNKTFSFEVQQPAVWGELMEVVAELVDHPGTIAAEIMDGGDGVISRFEFRALECISHSFDLDYSAGSNAVAHRIVMKYQSMRSA